MDESTGKPPGDGPGVAGAVKQEVAEKVAEGQRNITEGIQDSDRIYVAVHGIGDQNRFETIQQVVNRLGSYLKVPAAVPLGSFHSVKTNQAGFLFLENPPYSADFKKVGLAEIYWADIPREVQAEGHSLEESKKWAATLVARVRMRDAEDGKASLSPADYAMLGQVIDELIEGIAVIDRLLFLVGRVSPYQFELKGLLDTFLGDVQIVTDFEVERIKLLGRFFELMERIHEANPKAHIYIVAHSEGTVVSFLGLLKAFQGYTDADETEDGRFDGLVKAFRGYAPGSRSGRFGWIEQVKGMMTIGSPIEEHLIVWPELWEEFQGGPALKGKPATKEGRIKWRNYLDVGDPIAYRLTSTSRWIKEYGWDEVFDFDNRFDEQGPGRHEVQFSRYPFPGKAHVDYWGDEAVFGHFIETVVLGKTDGRFREPPTSHPLVPLFSRSVPYLIPAALILVAVYFMTRSVHGFLYPGGTIVGASGKLERVDSLKHVAKDVSGISVLLMGITIAARVPRLTRDRKAVRAAFLMFIAGLLAYPPLVTDDTRAFLGGFGPMIFPGLDDWKLAFGYTGPALSLMLVAAALVRIVMDVAAAYPRAGARTLIWPSCLIVPLVLILGIYQGVSKGAELGPIWPMLVAGPAFLYLWWLAVVLFDLIYIWHHYVRGSSDRLTVTDRLRDICDPRPNLVTPVTWTTEPESSGAVPSA